MKRAYRTVLIDILIIFFPLLLLLIKGSVDSVFNIFLSIKLPESSASEIIKFLSSLQINRQIILLLILVATILMLVRKKNKEKSFNFGNEYMDYPYFLFYIASKILGFSKLDLQRVPIYLQVRLILNDTFKEISYQDDLPDNDGNAGVKFTNNNSPVLTLVLEDTYPIEEYQLTDRLKNTDVLRITKENLVPNNRDYCPGFIETIDCQLHLLESKYSRVNICATTNTKHTFRIVSDNFKKGGRSNLSRLIIFQQNRDKERLFEKGYEIKL